MRDIKISFQDVLQKMNKIYDFGKIFQNIVRYDKHYLEIF